MRPIDGSLIAGVRAECRYPMSYLSRLSGRSLDTVNDWCRSRNGKPPKVASVPDPMDPRRRLVSGATILALFGQLMIDAAPPVESETEKQRKARADRAAAECRRLLAAGDRR